MVSRCELAQVLNRVNFKIRLLYENLDAKEAGVTNQQ
jgi:hypothetical protein